MEDLIIFFRDTLSGTTYIVTVVIAIILILACIGYLAEKGLNKKKNAAKYASVNSEEVSTTPVAPVNNVAESVATPKINMPGVPEGSPVPLTSVVPTDIAVSPVAEITPNVVMPPVSEVVDVNVNNNTSQ